MTDLDDLCGAALARLKHSIGTSAGMHKMHLRRKAIALQTEAVGRLAPKQRDAGIWAEYPQSWENLFPRARIKTNEASERLMQKAALVALPALSAEIEAELVRSINPAAGEI